MSNSASVFPIVSDRPMLTATEINSFGLQRHVTLWENSIYETRPRMCLAPSDLSCDIVIEFC